MFAFPPVRSFGVSTMSAEPVPVPEKLYTVDEFFDLVPDGQKADLIDGVIYMASPDTPHNAELTFIIHHLVRGWTRLHGGGKVYQSRVAYVLGPRTSPEPDVAFISPERLAQVKKTRVHGPPDLAVEIVAEESQSRDYDRKKRLYEASGVREYWIIDPLQQRCEFYRLSGGRYAPIPLRDEHFFHSEVLPGFWLDTRWLLVDPLPDEFDCLDRVLAGPPDTSA